MNPLITVYITNYNYGQYIQQSIESVLGQSQQDFELIIIDDGSTDNSKDIIEQYRDNPKISIIYQQNKGLNITNNIAMRTANGKYLMRLDADDFLEPKALEEMSNVLENNDKLGLVFPDYYYVDAEGNITGEEKRHNFNTEVSLYDQPAHGACTMIRLSFLKRLGGYNESFTCQDGYDLWIKFITHHEVSNVNKPLFSYRRHGNNLTTNEERILTTRQKIKEVFVEEHFQTPETIAVIPVRNTFIGKVNWPLYDLGGKSVLEQKIELCLQANKISHIVVTSSDKEILDHCREKYNNNGKVSIVERPKKFEGPNQTLFETIDNAVEHVQQKNIAPEAIMTVSLEYPFVKPYILDDVVNTLILFKSDAVLSVRPDNKMYYQHTGHTLKPILDQEKFTRLERDALYKGAGGVVISTIENFKKHKKMIGGSVSHVVVDPREAFGIFSAFDLEVVEAFKLKNEVSSLES